MRTLALSVVAAGLAAIVSLAHVPDAMAVKGKCETPKTAYRTTSDKAETDTIEWTDLPKSKIVFRQGGKKPGCVIVRVSAMPDAGYIIAIRAVIDGTIIAEPGGVQLDYQSADYLSPRGFEFIFPEIAPGKHALKIEWSNYAEEFAEAYLYKRSIVLHHR